MKVFVCSRSTDKKLVIEALSKLEQESNQSIAVLQEKEHSDSWKKTVETKFSDVDFVIFYLGSDTFNSESLKWELQKAKELNKRIIGIKLSNVSNETLMFFHSSHIFNSSKNAVCYMNTTFCSDQKLLVDQYKIMVSSTEKVTDQRLKVNNLFFTITSSVLSISVVVGKTLSFSLVAIIGMLLFAVLAFLVTYFWEKLIKSYGKLNTGKFQIIDEIEKKLRTNMFEREWYVLQEVVEYDSNTETEVSIITSFRKIIVLIFLIELLYLLHSLGVFKYILCQI